MQYWSLESLAVQPACFGGKVHACSQQLLARLSQSFFYLLGFMRRLRFGARTQERASDLSDSTSTNQIARIKHDAVSTNHMHTGCA